MLYKSLFITSLVLFLALTLTQCTLKQETRPVISGTVSNASENYMLLYQIEDMNTRTDEMVDTIFVDGKGQFKYNKPLATAIYALKVTDSKTIQLAIEEGQFLLIEEDSIGHFKITGSVDTDLLMAYEKFRIESLTRLVYTVRNQIKALKSQEAAADKMTALRSLEVKNYAFHLAELAVYIQNNMGTSIAIYPTSIRWNTADFNSYTEVVTAFNKKHPNTVISKKLTTKINILEKTAIGSTVADLVMPSADSVLISLEAIQGKYTIIDFWASWCPPCRSESALLGELYKNYHSQGFEIYGISLDKRKQRWVDALKKDNRVWPNVSTLEGLTSPTAIAFGISALPTNLIIDHQGKIIATNIHGEHLKAFIENLF
ncbi:MAG: thiol-disulfide isomerase/thioredoxin/PBP1b-binding outer membrane lipoprotein LpoB [Salibacteraceae bacterium]|jgi:thiol-disulfide isomerase/thioredoxin/PBP1b-binding outer membrane lipoprotein LpoB